MTTRPLVAFVSFYQGQVKAFETAPLAVTQALDAKSKAVPLRFSLALEKLPPGQYNNTTDTTTQHNTTHRVACADPSEGFALAKVSPSAASSSCDG
jgi:hypothetical protein